MGERNSGIDKGIDLLSISLAVRENMIVKGCLMSGANVASEAALGAFARGEV